MNREELEYSLPQDVSELPGQVYKALTTSRWDSPEMVAVFADTMRRKEILTKTNLAFKNIDHFRQDLNLIRDASPADFEALEGYATLGQAFTGQKGKQNPRAFAALKNLMITTSNVALTEGNKMKLRHFGHAMNLLWLSQVILDLQFCRHLLSFDTGVVR